MKEAIFSTMRRTRTLGGLALCSVLLMGSMLPLAGCTVNQAAQRIDAMMPALESALGTVDSALSSIDPEDAAVFAKAALPLAAVIAQLHVQEQAYLANPTASVLAKLQAAAVAADQTVNASLLQAVGIKDSESQHRVLAALGVVATLVTVMLGLVQSVSSKSALAQMSRDSPLKLAMVAPYLDRRLLRQQAEEYGTTVDALMAQQAQAGF